MSGIRRLIASAAVLAIASAVLLGGSIAAVIPAGDFVANRSTSPADNLLLIGGLTLLAVLAALAEALLVIRLIWGAEAVVGKPASRGGGQELDTGAIKVTGTKKAVVVLLALAINILVLDQLGSGVLVTQTRRHNVLSLLRSEDGGDRAEAVEEAIQLVGDPRVTEQLKRVLSEPGEGREWVAYAAGVRIDRRLADELADLLEEGEPLERAAAMMALARISNQLADIADESDRERSPEVFESLSGLEELRPLQKATASLSEMDEHRKDLLIGIGTLGRNRHVVDQGQVERAGRAVAGALKSGELGNEEAVVGIWVLGRLGSPAALEYLHKLLSAETDLRVLCPTMEALGHIGAAVSSDHLVSLIEEVDRSERCPEVVAEDFTGHEVLLCRGTPVVERILREIAHIGDRQAMPAVERIAKDESYSRRAREMAAEIAYQMRFVKADQR